MSGWKGPHLAIYHLRFLKPPSDWDLILPKRFTVVSSGLNVQCHNEAEFAKAIDALGRESRYLRCRTVRCRPHGGITLETQRGYAAEQQAVAELSRQVGLPVSTAMSATAQAMKPRNP